MEGKWWLCCCSASSKWHQAATAQSTAACRWLQKIQLTGSFIRKSSVGSFISARLQYTDSTRSNYTVIGLHDNTTDGLFINWAEQRGTHRWAGTLWSHLISISIAVRWWTCGGRADQCLCWHRFIYSQLYIHMAYPATLLSSINLYQSITSLCTWYLQVSQSQI